MATCNLTAQRLRELLTYDPATGEFFKRSSGKALAAAKPGNYKRITIGRNQYYGHRLAWLWVTGKWPDDFIDHIDGNRSNTRFENLREADRTTNNQNRRTANKANSSGLLGVCWASHAKLWVAQICTNRVNKKIGYFKDRHEAHDAYLAAKRRAHKGSTI